MRYHVDRPTMQCNYDDLRRNNGKRIYAMKFKASTTVVSRFAVFSVLLLSLIFSSGGAWANSLEQELNALANKARNSNFEVAAIEEPVLFRTLPTPQTTQEVLTFLRIEDKSGSGKSLLLSAQIFKSFLIEESNGDDLRTVASFRVGETKHTGGGNFKTNLNLPGGTKVVSISDALGNVKDVRFAPPEGVDPMTLPKPGTAEFNEIIKYVAPSAPFPKDAVAQGENVLPPILFPVGLPENAVTHKGDPPKLAGKVSCGTKTCLLVIIDEEMNSANVPGLEMKVNASGYSLYSEDTFATVESIVWTLSEIKTSQKHVVQESVMVIQPTENE